MYYELKKYLLLLSAFSKSPIPIFFFAAVISLPVRGWLSLFFMNPLYVQEVQELTEDKIKEALQGHWMYIDYF